MILDGLTDMSQGILIMLLFIVIAFTGNISNSEKHFLTKPRVILQHLTERSGLSYTGNHPEAMCVLSDTTFRYIREFTSLVIDGEQVQKTAHSFRMNKVTQISPIRDRLSIFTEIASPCPEKLTE